ncbi:hypothetical protein SCAR479_04549 [Seiridium cardinale]|uniref:Uncharacterized protein n=1 Tax=Seiridium cardinale TaxID=138064 RepID=A0ABR2XXP6_9PEZI
MPQPNTFPNEIWLLVAVESHGRGLTGIAGASTHMRNMLISHLAERLRFQGTQGEVVTARHNLQDTQLLRYDRTSRLPPILPFVRRVAIVVNEAVPAIPIVPDGQLPLPTGGIDLPVEIARLLVSSQIPTFDSLFLDIWDMHLTQVSLMIGKMSTSKKVAAKCFRIRCQPHGNHPTVCCLEPATLKALYLYEEPCITMLIPSATEFHHIERLRFQIPSPILYFKLGMAFPKLQWLIMCRCDSVSRPEQKFYSLAQRANQTWFQSRDWIFFHRAVKGLQHLRRLAIHIDPICTSNSAIRTPDPDNSRLHGNISSRALEILPSLEEVCVSTIWPFYWRATRVEGQGIRLERKNASGLEQGEDWPYGLFGNGYD